MTRLTRSLAATAALLFALPLAAAAQEAAPKAAEAAPERAEEMALEVYDVRDLVTEPRDFPAPKLGLPKAAAAEKTEGPERPGRTLEDLAKEVRALEGLEWPAGTKLQTMGGSILVRQTKRALKQIREFLHAVRTQENRLITIEARFVTVPAETVARYADGLHVIRAERAQAFLALAKNANTGRIIAAPRVTAFDGQRANVSIATQVSYISGFEVKATRGAIAGDPVVSTLTEGLTIEVRGRVRRDGWIDVDVAAQQADLLRPIPEVKTRFGTVQVPEVVAQELRTRGSLPKDHWAMLVGLTDVEADGRAGSPVIVLVRFVPMRWK